MVERVGNMLSAAQSARLLALQKTARQLDVASARLASGQKLQGAIDGPQNFFTARGLNNRAADLSRLLDGIGQNIRAIQQAENGIRAELEILDLAESYILDVLEKFDSGLIASNKTNVRFAGSGDLVPYDASQDVLASGTITVSGDSQVQFSGNYWRRKAINYTITPETYLTFEFRSTAEPEIVAIGFDNDANFGNDSDRFYLYGTQTSGITYAAPFASFAYTGAGAWQTIQIPVGAYFTGGFSFMTFINDDDAAPLGNSAYRNIVLSEGLPQDGADLSSFRDGYAKIINQIDEIVKDSNYRGINLLRADKMTTYFNEDRSNFLVSEGLDASFAGLGLDRDDFSSIQAVRQKLDQIRAAREILRGYGRTLATDLTVLQTREVFTGGIINTLKAGAEDLTAADLNEEGARMLALQTQQQLGVISLAFPQANILTVLA